MAKASAGSSSRVVVIGAGIVGVSAAFFLRELGHSVLVLDADTPMAGATGASDGAVSVGSKKPGLMMNLAQAARDFYGELEGGGVLAGLFDKRPTFMFARNDLEAEVLSLHGKDLRDAGVRVDPLTTADLSARIPGIGSSIVSAMAVPDDGHALGYQIVGRLLQLADVEVVRHARVLGIRKESGRATGVDTTAGFFGSDAILIAAGLGSADVAGLGDFLVPRKGQIVITDRAADNKPAMEGPLMSAAYLAAKRDFSVSKKNPISLVIDPLKTGQFLVGGTREEGLDSKTTTVDHVSQILREAISVYPGIARRRVIRTFAGVRTATIDGLPVVGAHPRLNRVFIATGFEGDGICLGPLIGRTCARLITGCDVDVDVSALSPQRFVDSNFSGPAGVSASGSTKLSAACGL